MNKKITWDRRNPFHATDGGVRAVIVVDKKKLISEYDK